MFFSQVAFYTDEKPPDEMGTLTVPQEKLPEVIWLMSDRGGALTCLACSSP